jgi:hypothetical protein
VPPEIHIGDTAEAARQLPANGKACPRPDQPSSWLRGVRPSSDHLAHRLALVRATCHGQSVSKNRRAGARSLPAQRVRSWRFVAFVSFYLNSLCKIMLALSSEWPRDSLLTRQFPSSPPPGRADGVVRRGAVPAFQKKQGRGGAPAGGRQCTPATRGAPFSTERNFGAVPQSDSGCQMWAAWCSAMWAVLRAVGGSAGGGGGGGQAPRRAGPPGRG